ncbi:hypothetical protein E3E35_02600 [Thermococcus sp. GR7]|uniref:hypothetical protein n=1 Tax=unclassified Thermococcus TaxID=2627626 RepID=UPI0014304396|nr:MULTISPECIES: hypothetical protein [unclassified Thermococcus]NJE46321.1 hypothetical protein [Thermococcus sp. GR7]NJE79606.1 hypothetical protein [Thermococcus sp. GR4]NJF23800.1 hypothetical protein [Thermococcus sp. GR5]
MKEIFNAKGLFVKYTEKKVKLENGDELTHRSEEPTELWWKLKEAVKGKKVRIIVYEIEE